MLPFSVPQRMKRTNMLNVERLGLLFTVISSFYTCNDAVTNRGESLLHNQANNAGNNKLDLCLQNQGINVQFRSHTMSSTPMQSGYGAMWEQRKTISAELGQVLTMNGYAELINSFIKRAHAGKCKFLKKKLDCYLLILTILLTIQMVKTKTTTHVFTCLVFIQLMIIISGDCVGLGMYYYFLVIFYLLLRSGVEPNPGPPKHNIANNDNHGMKKRVRKSGKTYCVYLTGREPLESAPKYVQKELHDVINKDVFKGENNAIGTPLVKSSLSINDEATNKQPGPPQVDSQNGCYVEDCSFEDKDHLLFTSDQDKSMDSSMCGFYVESNSDDSFSDSETNLTPPTSDSSDESSSGGCDDISMDDFEWDKTDLKDIPVYEGARISTGASMLLHITFALQENLTGNGLVKLLNLTEMHCKENNTIPTSLHIFKKWFKNLKIPPKKHMYCSSCLFSIDNDMLECPNEACKSNLSNQESKSYFVEIPLIEQLHKLFFNKTFRENILFRFKRQKKKTDNIEDIYDGKLYKSKEQFFSDPNNISLMWNTDGIPLFKSSKVSMWPLYFAINELPFKVRRNPENLLLSGLWIGPKKPQMLTFLKPFMDDLLLLENGTKVNIDDGGSIIVKGMLIAGTADLPAKCAVCNMVQYNGKYSCPHCTQSGKTAVTGKGRCHIFPFDFENPTGPKRSHHESLIMAETASETGNPVFGIKGPCWFTTLKNYDFVTGNCTDYMHCVLLGVTKRLTTFWFSKDYLGKEYNFYHWLGKVNERIGHLKPPLTIHRMPRSIDDLKHWKASEFRSWLLFYAPILLCDILTPGHYKHFLLFSNAMYLLLNESISQEEIDVAENYLELFVIQFSDLYEERFITLNIHLLLHLPENVRQLGPLWAYSCFPFEDANGYLLKLIKGTQTVESQITDTLAIVHGVPFLESECISQGSAEETLLKKMKNLSCGTEKHLDGDIYSLGKGVMKEAHQLSPDYFIAISNFLKKPLNGCVILFKRILKGNKTFHSLEYSRAKVRNSYTIKYISKEHAGMTATGNVCFGVAKIYAQYVESNTELKKNLVILLPLREIDDARSEFPLDEITERRLMTHFVTCQNINYMATNYVAVEIKDILDICLMMKTDNEKIYLCCAPNLLEKD